MHKVPERLPPTMDPRKKPKNWKPPAAAPPPPVAAAPPPPAKLTYDPHAKLTYEELIKGGHVRVWWTKTMAGRLERFQYGTVTVVGPASLPRRKRDPHNCTFEVTYPDQPCGAEGGKFLHDLEQVHVERVPEDAYTHYFAYAQNGALSHAASEKATAQERHSERSPRKAAVAGTARGAAPAPTAAAPTAAAEAQTVLRVVLSVGARVLARYLATKSKGARRQKSGANAWWRGTITAVGSGTYNIEYDDDGVKEEGVLDKYVQPLDEEEDEEGDDEDDEDDDEEDEEEVKEEEEEEVKEEDDEEEVPKPPEPPHEGSLRHDIFRALCDGHSTRAAIIDYVDHHGKSSTRGKSSHNPSLLQADVVTALGKETKRHGRQPLWWKDVDKYGLSAEGEVVRAKERAARKRPIASL